MGSHVYHIYWGLIRMVKHQYKCLNGLAPAYRSSCFSFHIQTRAGLRSASDKTRLAENKPSSKSLQSAASKSFSLAAPGLWNHLPITIRTSISLPIFKKALKKHLFPVCLLLYCSFVVLSALLLFV